MGWVAAMSPDGCDYVQVFGPSASDLSGDSSVPYVEAGLAAWRGPTYYPEDGQWRVMYTEECQSYDAAASATSGTGLPPANASGWEWKLSEILSFLALAFGGSGALLFWVGACIPLSRIMWRAAAYEILAAALFLAGSFLWFLNPLCDPGAGNNCRMHFGAKCNACAALFWTTAAVAALFRYPVPRPKPEIVHVRDTMEMGSGRITVASSTGDQLSRKGWLIE